MHNTAKCKKNFDTNSKRSHGKTIFSDSLPWTLQHMLLTSVSICDVSQVHILTACRWMKIFQCIYNIRTLSGKKIIIYLYQLQKQVEKRTIGEPFLACFAASTNELYIYWHITDDVFILQYGKSPKQMSNCLKILE